MTAETTDGLLPTNARTNQPTDGKDAELPPILIGGEPVDARSCVDLATVS